MYSTPTISALYLWHSHLLLIQFTFCTFLILASEKFTLAACTITQCSLYQTLSRYSYILHLGLSQSCKSPEKLLLYSLIRLERNIPPVILFMGYTLIHIIPIHILASTHLPFINFSASILYSTISLTDPNHVKNEDTCKGNRLQHFSTDFTLNGFPEGKPQSTFPLPSYSTSNFFLLMMSVLNHSCCYIFIWLKSCRSVFYYYCNHSCSKELNSNLVSLCWLNVPKHKL